MVYNFWFRHARGLLLGRVTGRGVAEIVLPYGCGPTEAVDREDCAVARRLAQALYRYFAGRREGFWGIELDLDTGTPFQRRVWAAAREIPWGETVTYGELARRVGCGSARAVGQALGANPVPIVVPCHRILAAGGLLGGFSGGLEWKRELLGLENVPVQGR